jgi:hypothetical protein
MACTACLVVWLVLLVAATNMPLEKAMLVAVTKQNLSNLLMVESEEWTYYSRGTVWFDLGPML